jgi:hypothetical protein
MEHVRVAYAFLKMHTPLKKSIRYLDLGLGFGFELVGLSKPPSWAHFLKLHCDRHDSIVIKTGDSGFW